MVRQAHHDRLDHPLVPSIKLRTGSELIEGYASFIRGIGPFKPFQSFNRFAPFKTFAEQRPSEELPRFGNSRNVELILDQQNSRALYFDRNRKRRLV
jgi:hypothetical protein